MNNLSLDELERQTNRTKDQAETFYTVCGKMEKEFNNLNYQFQSYDSNLGKRADEYFNNFSTMKGKFYADLNSLVEDMRTYIASTRKNEATAEANISETTQELSSNSSNL